MSFMAWFLMGLAVGGVVSLVSVGYYMFTQHIRFKNAIATLNRSGFTAHRYQVTHEDKAIKGALEFIEKRGYIVANARHTPVGTVTAHHSSVPNYKLRFERAS